MCGLAGVYSAQFTAPELSYFEKLLFLASLRGTDSTGIIRANKSGTIRTTRSLLDSPTWLNSKHSEFLDADSKKDGQLALLGHTRHATKGNVILKNAHPFSFKHVVGMHNGTIHAQFKHRKEYDTDSEALYRNINDYGIKAAIEEVNAHDTAYALQWIDKSDGTLNFIRNSRRPLWFTYIFGTSTLIWSSEKEMLELVLKHKKCTTNKGWDGDDKERFFTLKPNHLLTIKLGESPAKAEITDLGIEEKKGWTSSGYYGHGQAYGAGYADFWEEADYDAGVWVKTERGYQWRPKSSYKSSTSRAGESNVIELPPPNGSGVPAQGKPDSGMDELFDNIPFEGPYSNTKDRYTKDDLDSLAWLREQQAEQQREERDDEDLRGYNGEHIDAKRLQHVLSCGCFSCGTIFDVDDPDDADNIANVHWWDRDNFACDDCYRNSSGDWVRKSIEDDWDDATSA